MTVRAMEAGDVGRVASLEASCLDGSWGEGSFRRILDDATWVVLVADGAAGISGFAAARLVAVDEGELLLVAVEPASRRGGIGRALVAAVQRALATRGVVVLHLGVRAGNAAAIGLYRSLGFRVTRHARGLYREPDEDGVEMAWRPPGGGAPVPPP